MRCRLAGLLSVMLLAGIASPAAAQDVAPPVADVVILINDDRITGKIRSYNAGRLTVQSDNEGDVSIKWNKIRSITSATMFDVQLTNGAHELGVLAPSEPPGKLAIVSGPGIVTVEFLDVYRIDPIRRTFWRRIDGTLDLGFNYTKASQLVQFNLNTDATYRMRNWAIASALSMFFSRQQDVTASQRGAFSLFYTRFLKNRWIAGTAIGLDRNLDLGLDLRVLASVGAGRKLIQTNRTQLIALAGVSVNHESPVNGEGKYNAEALVMAQYSVFTYDFPKMNFEASLQV
ncbi:MAG: DUF481 domain-containing protein, partial [Thermoanaerobaculia bacterium]